MPSKSSEQHKLMEAAAHTPGGYDGVPQAVGKEFVAADAQPIKAAGIIYSAAGKILFVKRGAEGDHAGEWAFPGGKIEAGETPKAAAIREFFEETGHLVESVLPVDAVDNFTTFCAAGEPFDPKLDDESTDCVWASPGQYPEPLHPAVALLLHSEAFRRIGMNELDIARAMAAGDLTSPQRYMNVWLFALRITGTGVAYRSGLKEFVFRDPALYLNDEFLARCNGLSVIWEHPEKNTLNSDEFADRVIGSILLPYIKPDEKEVWGIAKIYDAPAAEQMEDSQLSTSPTVVFGNPAANNSVTLNDGATLLIEGVPSLLDHLAICVQGVWDKGGPPSGVSTTNVQEPQMTEDELKAKADAEAKEKEKAEADAKAKADADDQSEKEFREKVLNCMDSFGKRLDSIESKRADTDNLPAPPMTAADKAKADAEAEAKEKAEKEKADADEKEKAEQEAKAKADADAVAIKERMDAIEKAIPKQDSDEDYAEMADAQAKADSVFAAFGDSAPRPLRGENLLGYRKRIAGKLKSHSESWKDVDINALDVSVIGIAETQIYADSLRAATHPIDMPAGTLRAIEKKDGNGQIIRTFVGDPNAWMGDFKGIPMKQVSIHKGNQQ